MLHHARRLLVALLSLASVHSAAAAERIHVAVGERPFRAPAETITASLTPRAAPSDGPIRRIDLTVPGATAADIRAGQLTRAMALRPSVVSVALGPADVCGSTPLRSFARDVEIILDLLRRNSGTVVVSAIPTPTGSCPHSAAALRYRLDAFGWAVARAAERNGLEVVPAQPGADEEAASATQLLPEATR